MAILSIQSHVAYGHVGNSAAVFPLQRLGQEVWPLHTVMFSNHPGYGAWSGPVLDATDVRAVFDGIEARGVLPECAAVLSGYMGDVSLGAVVLDAVARVRAANRNALYVCDPVMGDTVPGLYVREGIPAFMRDHAVPAADIVLPNQFELELLTDGPAKSLEQVLAAGDRVLATGPGIVVVTSLRFEDRGNGDVGMLAITADGAWLAETPFLTLPVAPNGAGDATAALFTAFFLETREPAAALARTTDAVFAIFEATRAAGTRELQIIAAQDELSALTPRFVPVKVR